jgi:hypothetical protein
MANFFTSPGDLTDWIRREAKTEQDAAELVASLPSVGTKDIDSIRESVHRIYANTDSENASGVLFKILASAGITEEQAKQAVVGLGQVKVAEYLHANKIITAEQKASMIKEAQIMRQPGEYPMPLRYCPKLLGSVGKRLISTYNCRHYCLDGLVFDDDPERVYCGETLWRRHVMDKFSTEWKDRETGQYVGGYINGRFYVYHDVSANQMELKPNERTRKPRPHQWSTERRLVEQREKGSGYDLTLGKVAKAGGGQIKVANVSVEDREEQTRANGYITKNVGGFEFELAWTLRPGPDGSDEVEIEWLPEAMGGEPEEHPGTWSGTVYHPDTGQKLIDGLERENLEQVWKNEILDAVYHTAEPGVTPTTAARVSSLDKTASVAEQVLRQADGFTVLASIPDSGHGTEGFGKMMEVFSEVVALKTSGMKDDDAALAISKKYAMPLYRVVTIQAKAIEKMEKHQSDAYQMEKTAGIDEDAVDSGLVEAPKCEKCGKQGTLSGDRKQWMCEGCKSPIKARQ